MSAVAPRRYSLETAVLVALPATMLAVVGSASWSRAVRGVALPARTVALAVLCGLAIAYARERRARPAVGSPSYRLAAVLVALALASAGWSVDAHTTGLHGVAFALVIGASGAIAVAVARDGAAARRVLWAILAGAAIAALVGVGVYVVSSGAAVQPAAGHAHARFRGIGVNPNTVSMLLAAATPLALLLAIEAASPRVRLAGVGALMLFAVSIGASGSRGALAAGVAGLLIFGLTGAIERAQSAAALGAIASLAIAAAVFGAVELPGGPAAAAKPRPAHGVGANANLVLRLEDEIGYRGGFHPASQRSLSTGSGRLDAWRGALRQGAHRPLLGYGFGTEDEVFVDRFQDFEGGVPENSFIGLFLQLGGLGAALLVALLAALAIAAIRALALDRRMAAACLSVLAGGIVLAVVQSYLYAPGNDATLPVWVCAFLPAARAAF
jgi:O-antigen ligase